MKKVFYSILVILLLGLGIFVYVVIPSEEEIEPVIIDEVSLMEFGRYKKIKVNEIDYIEKVRYTEGGRDSVIYRDTYKINSTYNYLASKKVGSKTEMACEDNTTIYRFHMIDNTNISIEIECGILIDGRNRYLLK